MADSISQLSREEAQRVLTDIAGLSESLERLVKQSVSVVLADRVSGTQPGVGVPPVPQPAALAAPPVAPAVVATQAPPAAPHRPVVQPPVPETGVWGKDKGWDELTAGEKADASTLGYDGELWDAGESPEVCNNPWKHLALAEQTAASRLGYSAALWDAELGDEAEDAAVAVSEDASAPLPPPSIAPSPLPSSSVPTAPPPAPAPPAAPSTPPHPNLARPPPVAPAAPAPAPAPAAPARSVATDGSLWADLNFDEQNAAMLLGYDEASWDAGETVPTCMHPWLRLSTVEQNAATLLGYRQAIWDAELAPADPEDGAALEEPTPPPMPQHAPPPQHARQPAPQPARQALPPQPALAPVAGNAEDSSWATISSNRRTGNRSVPSSSAAPVRAPSSAINAATLPRFDAGMMFGCKRDTFDENMSRHLFGLPASHFRTANQITDATALFLFNYSTRQLHGVFLRDGPAGMDLEPQAWAHHRKPGASQSSSPYPAQVRWRALKMCKPIHESLWRDVPTTKQIRNGSQPIYELFMNAQQAQRLAELCLRHG